MKERKISWIELFYDLIFVVGISRTTHWLYEIEDTHYQSSIIILKYLLMVIPMLWAWTGQTMFCNRFGENEKYSRVLMLIQIFFVILMVASFNLDFDATYFTFIIGYLGIRTMTIIQYLLAFYLSGDRAKRSMIYSLLGGMIISILVIASSLFFTGVIRYVILFSGIVLDIIFPLIKNNPLKKSFIDLPHLIERLALLCMITFGEAIVSIVLTLQQNLDNVNTFIYIVIALIALISMWNNYFNQIDVVIDKTQQTNGQVVLYSNLLIAMSIMIFAAGIGMGYHEKLPVVFISLALIISFSFFILLKHLIFNYHRKEEFSFQHKILIYVVLMLITLTILTTIFNIEPIFVLAVLAIISLFDTRKVYLKTN